MTRRTAPLARGILLGQLLAVLAIMAVLLLLLGKLILDGLYVQRVAHEHASHVAVADDLARRLSRDTLAAISASEQADGVRLQTAGPEGTSDIRYAFEPQRVRRIVDDVEAAAWAVRRLRFDWHVETGPRGRVLLLDLLVDRPPKASDVLPMQFSRGFVLPAAESGPPGTNDTLPAGAPLPPAAGAASHSAPPATSPAASSKPRAAQMEGTP